MTPTDHSKTQPPLEHAGTANPYERRLAQSRRTIAAFRTTANAQRTRAERAADWLAEVFGSIQFILLHAVWFFIWIAWNDGNLPGLAAFDPFPYGLLTMIVSLEAIFLSAFVLLSQNRSAEIADLRSELELQLNIVQEEKTTAALRVLHLLARHAGLKDQLDEDLLELIKPIDLVALEHATRAETQRRPASARRIDLTVMQVRQALTANKINEALRLIQALKPPDQADVFEGLRVEQQADLLPRLTIEESADILEEMENEVAAGVAERLNVEVLGDILDEMEPDEAADVLGDMQPQSRDAALAAMDDAEEVRPLLIHPDKSAGGLMTSEFLALRRRMTAAEALAVVRDWAPENEALYTLFVVDREGTLVGVLSLRELVTADPQATLKDVMDPDVIYVTVDAAPEDIRPLTVRYSLLAVPVVDTEEKRRLLGVITVDDLIQEEEEDEYE